MKVFLGISMAVALASTCLAAGAASPTSSAAGSPAVIAASYVQEGGWDAPPREMDEITRRGFHDGVEGARKDYENHRRPDVNNRDEYRDPHLRGPERRAYRRGFERGYQAGVDHLFHGRR